MKINQRIELKFTSKQIVISILLVSLLLRWILIMRGGQYFNSDETRYEVSRDAARILLQGQTVEALRQFTFSPEHLGFKVIGIIPALAEHIVGPSLKLPAMFYSFFSVLNLYLIFLLSRRGQTSSIEPVYALFLAASCLSLLYYSRHIIPYDMAMSLGLLAVYIAVARSQNAWTSLLCGGLSFLCFITYNGYWPLAAFAILANILINNENKSKIVQKSIWTAIGFIIPMALLIMLVRWLRSDLVAAYRLFAETITQGSFQEGWSIPFQYFWHTEHTVILVMGAFSVLALFSRFKDSRLGTKLWLGGVLFIYACLVIPSLLHFFVVNARLARQLIPFLVLLAARGFAQMEYHLASGYKIARLILLIIFIQAAWNYAASYRLSYPRDFAAEAEAKFPGFEFSTKRLAFGAPVICYNNGYVIQNAKFFVTPPTRVPTVTGQLLLSASHPANFLPYQFEGDPPDVRHTYSILKLRMNFYKVDEQFKSQNNPDWMDIRDCAIN